MESNLRTLVKQYMDGMQWESALFWADVMMSMSNGNMEDTLAYIRCLIELGQHLRALSFMEHRGLLKAHKVFQYLGARCLLASRRFEELVHLVESPLLDTNFASSLSSADQSSQQQSSSSSSIINNHHHRTAGVNLSSVEAAALSQYARDWRVDAGLLLLLGMAFEKLENRQQAAEAYKQCLRRDSTCVEAFDRLNRRHMLTESDERDMLKRLFDADLSGDRSMMAKLSEFLYKSKAAKTSFADPPASTTASAAASASASATSADPIIDQMKKELSTNLSVMANNAERLYYQSNYRDSYQLTVKILGREEFHSDALPVHVANLLALTKTTELFSLAHRLIDSFPDLLISWYAVACYYYSIENYEASKRFFHKCTLLDPQHGASWIGYGHSFAVEQEHDQAMNCYVKAAKVMSSCHLPLMYVGLEYSLTNNLRLAEKFFSQASTMSPDDPYVLHELGVLAYRLDNYTKAEEYFVRAERVVGDERPITEQLLNNLGHANRKLKRYDIGLYYHRRALKLAPRNASTLAAIGYLYMFLEQFETAVEHFHQSLSLKRDDAFVTALLNKAMDILNDSWKPSFPEPPVLQAPKLLVAQNGSAPPKKTTSSKAQLITETTGDDDVEMEDV